MDKILKKIYEDIIYYEKDVVQMDNKINMDIDEILESYQKELKQIDINIIKELLYKETFNAQREGFKLGMRYMLKLCLYLLK